MPDELLAKMRAAGQGRVYDLWQAAGGRNSGSWAEVFGWAGGEMYVNVWLGEGGWRIPGETHPSGGAVAKVLDIYRWCA